MLVTDVMKARFQTPTFLPGTWVELTEEIEVGEFLQGIRCKKIGTRGQFEGAACEVTIVARVVQTPWEYSIQFQGDEETFRGISEEYLKAVPWLVQLALTTVDDGKESCFASGAPNTGQGSRQSRHVVR